MDNSIHIAIIMDGNGRWAKDKNKARIFGHKSGVKRVRDIVEFCVKDKNIDTLTLYTFSSENWNRPELEIVGLMNLIIATINKEINSLAKNGVIVKIIGDVYKLREDVIEKLIEAEKLTANNKRLILNLAINYGSKQEILNAVKLIVDDFKHNKSRMSDIDEKYFESKLFTHPSPSPDLLIRTGGEFRLRNFLLWQIAYTEIHVTETYWPSFGKKELIEAIYEYQMRERRFGKISEQLNINNV